MRASFLLFALLTAASAQAAPLTQSKPRTIGPATETNMDTAVARIHGNMLRAMGGEAAWKKARYFEFDFVPIRGGREAARWRHRWDRWKGEYRMSGVRGTDTIVALFNVNKPNEGQVQVNGAVVAGARRDSLLTYGYARFINDSYWLIMPYKWTDQGVNLTFQGRQTDDKGRTWDVIKLTFGNVGLTPQNQYLAFINPETGLMERWYHFAKEGAQPSMYDWKNWQKFGPIMLATEKPALDGSSIIRFENVRVLTSVPKRAFEF